MSNLNDLHDLNALIVDEEGNPLPEIPANRLDGNARIVITDKFNLAVKEIDPDIEALLTKDELRKYGVSSDGDAPSGRPIG